YPAHRAEFTLRLRIPAWSKRTTLTLNGRPAEADLKPGSYAAVKRQWNPGDRVELMLDMRGRVVDDLGKTGYVAVMRGPIVLAVDLARGGWRRRAGSRARRHAVFSPSDRDSGRDRGDEG